MAENAFANYVLHLSALFIPWFRVLDDVFQKGMWF
jgi:hypothetical protein